ncbi:MAG: DUF6591 domain-containing protein [Lachnospiraceae bacterium]
MKKKFFLLFATCIIATSIFACGNESAENPTISSKESQNEDSLNEETLSNKETETFSWPTNGIATLLPEPDGTISYLKSSNSKLTVHLKDVGYYYFSEYVNLCISSGFNIDQISREYDFSAYNSDGYRLNIKIEYSDDYDIDFSLEAPIKFTEMSWPTNGPATVLPTPKSKMWSVTLNTNKYFYVYINDSPKGVYEEYVNECIQNGFTINCSKTDDSFYAMNKEGYKLTVKYYGFNTMYISIDVTNEISTQPITQEPTTEKPTEKVTEKATVSDSVYYSTNDSNTVKNGNSGVYSYKKSGKYYDIYYIIDFNEGYVYSFCEGEGNTSCERIKIQSGNLNDVLIITFHDGGTTWSYGLHFKYKNQPNTLIVQDNDGFEYQFTPTSLKDALALKSKKTLVNY